MNKSALLLAGLALAGCHRVPTTKGSIGANTSTPVATTVVTPAGV